MELARLTLKQASDLVKKKEVSPIELTEAVLSRIESVDPRLNSYITLLSDDARRAAKAAESEIASGNYRGALHGIPVGLKDIFCMKGVRTTCGSRMLESFISPYDATVTARLKRAGAVILGKNNMDEFAMGSSTENSYFSPTRNPWDLERVPGGSSGGSAACVAASLGFGSIGTDTGGSIRQPAALCGVVGMKPTYGRVSRFGMIAFASSLDQAGPFGRTVEDAAILLNSIAGHDARDSTSANVLCPDFTRSLSGGLSGVRIGVPREYFVSGIDPEIESGVRRAIALIEDAGAEVREISLPHTEFALSAYYLLAPSEASSNLARFDGVRYGFRAPTARNLKDMYFKTRAAGFGSEVKRRIMIGTYALSSGYYDAYYLKAQRVRTLIKRDFDEAFGHVDVILTPTSPEPAFKIGEKTDDPLKMYLSDIFTIPCNLAGIPGMSIPCGFTAAGLPIGLQLLGRPFDEESLFKVAYNYEIRTGWTLSRPPL
ncbi:MAG: Asp-tRNA(Asn)/Glu-tRNA(Gln) amidotransferase subunit GatA [Deltaproteobacteria bacterium]